jgi:hypothetical protein
MANELSSVTSPGQTEDRLVQQGKIHSASILYRQRIDGLENISLCGLEERYETVTIPQTHQSSGAPISRVVPPLPVKVVGVEHVLGFMLGPHIHDTDRD